MTTARVIVSLLVATSGLAFIGCADPEPTNSDSDVRANVETNVTPKWMPPPGKCPDPAIGSKEKTEYYQLRASSVIAYVAGGKDPFTYEDVTYNPSCKDAQTALTNLRDLVSPYSRKITPQATLTGVGNGDVCGLRAALYTLDISMQVPQAVWDAQRKVGDQLDACWGMGVSGFYYADPFADQDKNHRIYIDPEPARLMSDLSGSTGATAAAVYETSGLKVEVLKWPATYVSSFTPPAAGTPCSTTDLFSGVETNKIIQGSGSYRKCY